MTRSKNVTSPAPRAGERGFALILAILALLLLTFLGLTLAATTSTELQIAANHRWNEQAYYNAEAGLELGKRVLMNANWTVLRWPVRGGANPLPAAPLPAVARNDHFGNPLRQFANGDCDADQGNVGYGWVLDDATAQAPYQNIVAWRDAGGADHPLNGAFTLWVRPRVERDLGGNFDESDEELVLTAEGTAPYVDDPGDLTSPVVGRFIRARRAVQVLEVVLSRRATPRCNKDESQAGGDAAGSGMKACDPIPNSLTGLGGGGTGDEINKTTR